MLEFAFAVVDVALARTALEENRNREQRLSVLHGAEQARRRNLADIPLAVQIFIVALAGAREVWVNFQIIAFNGDFAVDHSAAARMIGQTEGNARFVGHNEILSWIDVPNLSTVHKSQSSPEPVARPEPLKPH